MKKILILLLFISIVPIYGQGFSYGPIIGLDYGGAANDGVNGYGTDGLSSFFFGGYGEYGINENMGIKTSISFHKKDLDYKDVDNGVSDVHHFNLIEIAPSFKYDFGKEYQKGLYALVGPRISLITKATDDNGNDIKDAFKSTTVGADLGLGYRAFHYVDFQFIFSYDVTPFLEVSDNSTSRFISGRLSVNLDLEKLIEK